MKRRFAAAGLAAATALSLSVAPAQADEEWALNKKTSSEVTDTELGFYALGRVLAEAAEEGTGFSAPFKGSSEAGIFEIPQDKDGIKNAQSAVFGSSFRNDANQGYKLGTTYDILVGTGIALTILAGLGGFALQQGLLKLPKLPF